MAKTNTHTDIATQGQDTQTQTVQQTDSESGKAAYCTTVFVCVRACGCLCAECSYCSWVFSVGLDAAGSGTNDTCNHSDGYQRHCTPNTLAFNRHMPGHEELLICEGLQWSVK